MDSPVIIRGTFFNKTFVSSEPLPDVEGPAELIVHTHENPPKTLYHYCGTDAFYAILKGRNIWLSSTDFTNDSSEYQLLFDEAVKRLNATTNDEDRKHNEFLLGHLLNSGLSPYIACFSTEPDLLSQWRAYCGDGKGFAIGFSVEVLRQRIREFNLKDNEVSCNLWPVLYEIQEQTNILDNIQKAFLAAATGQNVPGLYPLTVGAAISNICTSAAYCKNHGFHEECEHRIVLFPLPLPKDKTTGKVVTDEGHSSLQFRATDRGIIPYYTFPFPENAITEIWLGPKNYARKNVDALQLFLKAKGYDADKIKISLSEVTCQ